MPTTLTIDKVVHGGLGLAHGDNGVVFVSDAIPGETVSAEVVGKKARCDFARPVDILAPSPDRREPFCPHAGRCGGCDWQHIVYDRQVVLKCEIFSECLMRQGRLTDIPDIDVITAEETRYRLRAQFKTDPDNAVAGFFQRGTNVLEPISSCPLLVEPLDRFLESLGPSVAGGSITQVKALCGDDGTIASSPAIDGLSGSETTITVGGHPFSVRGDSFFQNNARLLEQFGCWAADKVVGRHAVDLYGGAGFFSVMLGSCFEEMTLVELEPSLVELAQRNADANQVRGFSTRCAAAEEFLSSPLSQGTDCLIVDPPRQGLTRFVTDRVGTAAPATILYVSCDPATQARDIGRLVNHHGYRMTHAALFDLYPNTHHVETAIVMAKR